MTSHADAAKSAIREELTAELEPVLKLLQGLDPADANAAQALNDAFPLTGPVMQKVAALFARGVEEGSLCYREGGPNVSYSRVAKDLGATALSVDAVRMEGAALGHTHPQGEFDLCIPVAGEPLFDGHAPGWTVYAPGTWHVPSVAGGTMNILYFLPSGAIEFGPNPKA